jgi:predicted NAD/FAD-binding protein
VVGGSHRYVDQIAKSLTATARGVPVRRVRRTATGVEVHDDAGAPAEFERVVVATHADEALALLDAPTDEERRTLGAFGYSVNETVLHTDASLLPRAPRARASWNYYLGQCAERPDDVQVSYHMNRLHRLDESTDYVVTLNGTGRIDPDAVLARMVYTHPVYTETAVAAQRGLPALNDGKLAFAGAYHGWGFHEDGCLSGVRAAAALGVTW